MSKNYNDFNFFKKNINTNSEVIEKLKRFVKILDIYQKDMNLIGKSTRFTIWSRHILDSAQIAKFLHNEEQKYLTVDVGTGAGFPGVVLASLGRSDILLCEKSRKKIEFLKTISKECNLNLNIFLGKIEDLNVKNAKTVVARAFAPLKTLLVKVKHIIYKDTSLVLHKGENYNKEIEEAKNFFSFNYVCYDSITNPNSKILKIKNLKEINFEH